MDDIQLSSVDANTQVLMAKLLQ